MVKELFTIASALRVHLCHLRRRIKKWTDVLFCPARS